MVRTARELAIGPLRRARESLSFPPPMSDAVRSSRILHLLTQPPDFQTERSVEALCRSGAIDAQVDRARVGPAGRWSNRPLAILGLRKQVADLDVIHCWDGGA